MNKLRISCLLAAVTLCIVLTDAHRVSAQGKVIHTEFSGTEVHIAWLAQPAPEVLPSGNIRIRNWEHLWYDDADDDRLDGYATVFIDAILDPMGDLIHAGGEFTLSEKLDDYELDDFLGGTFDLDQVVLGDTLFEGTWNLTPNQDGARGVAMNDDGLKAFYSIISTENSNVNILAGRLLDPNSASQSVPEPSAFVVLISALLCVVRWRRRRS